MDYERATERALVILVGAFNYDPTRRGTDTEVDREIRQFVNESRLQDVSYNGTPGPSHYPAPRGSTESRTNAVYADLQWVHGVTTGYMVEEEEMRERKSYYPMMVTV